jgi:hypothetical protein
MSLSVKSMTIENIKGISRCSLNMDGRSLVALKGSNGVGKSSVLDAIRAVFEPGGDPALIRRGAKSGKIEMVLSDGVTLKKAITPKSYQLVATGPDGVPIPSPAKYVASLAQSFAFDPVAFLTANKRERMNFLLDAMPITFARVEVEPGRAGGNETLTLDEFDKYRAAVYERRRAINAQAKELDQTIANLSKSLPAQQTGPAPDIAGRIGELTAARSELEAFQQSEIAEVVTQANVARDEARGAFEQDVRQATAVRDTTLAAIDRAEREAGDAIKATHAENREAVITEITVLQGQLAREGETRALAKHLAEQQQRYGEKADEAAALERSLAALDKLRQSKLESLPIPGLEIREGEVFYGGVPFDHLNQARKWTLSLEIGCLKLGDLGLIVVDEAEHLDDRNWPEFEAAVRASGLQVIAARVESGPLTGDPEGSLFIGAGGT